MLISRHRDGRLIAETIRRLGIDSIAGSSSKGGSAAVRKMTEALKAGTHVGITPDGPRGPAQEAKSGVAKLAQMSGCPILPCALYPSRAWYFRSWDAMFLVRPWSRLSMAFEQPFYIDADLSLDEATKKVQEVLERVNLLAKQAS